jgi:uncharacterized membrane protein
MYMQTNAIERMNELFMRVGLGEFSIVKYLWLVVTISFVLVVIPATVAVARGAGKETAIKAARDVMIGIPCAILIFTIPLFFYFVGRGYLTGLFGKATD